MSARTVGFWLLIAFGLAAPWLGIYPTLIMKCWCFALLCVGFNLMAGYAGMISFGHAAFFGTASYVTGQSIKALGLSTLGGIAAGTVAALLLGVLIGGLSTRRRGIYFSMISLALAQMVFFIWVQVPFAGNEDGLQNIPRGTLFGVWDLNNNTTLYYLVFSIFVLGFLFLWRVVDSPFGQVLHAIRENEPRAVSLGYAVNRYKLAAFVMSAGLAGAAGATKSVVYQLASLTDVHWTMSGEIILMTLLGGMGTLFGPVIGAFLIIILESELIRYVGSWVQFILGGVFVLCVLGFRAGIAGTAGAWFARRRRDTH